MNSTNDSTGLSVGTSDGVTAEASSTLAGKSPLLSLVVPVYNEAAHLEYWCNDILARDFGFSREFVFVDDCSTDGSREILRAFAGRPDVVLIEAPRNTGKGAALAAGIGRAQGEVVLIQDADFEYSLRDIPELVAPIVSREADVVYGSRYVGHRNVHRTFHYLVNKFLTLFSNIMSGLYVTDMETCRKAFRRDLIQNIALTSPRFGFEPEITARIADLNVRVVELPVRYSPRNQIEGKKIRWTDGIAALWFIVKFNLQRSGARRALARVPARYRPS